MKRPEAPPGEGSAQAIRPSHCGQYMKGDKRLKREPYGQKDFGDLRGQRSLSPQSRAAVPGDLNPINAGQTSETVRGPLSTWTPRFGWSLNLLTPNQDPGQSFLAGEASSPPSTRSWSAGQQETRAPDQGPRVIPASISPSGFRAQWGRRP